MPKINSLEVVHQDTNKDSYETLHDIIVGLKGSQNQEVVDGEARALYEALLEMYVNDKEAFARRIETLSAKFGNSLAQVVEEMLAYASASEAYAKKITTVSAEVATANAMVQTEMYARATEDEALAQLITTLSATVGSKNRTYYQTTAPSSGMVSGDLWIDSDDDKLYRYNGSSWVNIQDNQIGVNTAAISNEATARATADSANATAINAVTARLDTGDFATVKTESSATASKVTGIEAKWGVTTNVNGQVAGIQLLNGTGTQSSFTVAADKFIVKKPDGTNGIEWNGAVSRLNIAGDIYANNLYGNVVGTSNINNNAVSSTLSSTSNTNYAGTSNWINTNIVTITNNSSSPMPVTGTYQCQTFYSAVPALAGYRVGNGSVFIASTSISSIPNEMPIISFYDVVPANSTRSYSGDFWGEAGKVNTATQTLTSLGLKK